MNKQEIIEKFNKQIKIENYSEKKIKNYHSVNNMKKFPVSNYKKKGENIYFT